MKPASELPMERCREAEPFEIPALLAIYVFYGVYILIHDWICYFGGLETSLLTYLGAAVVFGAATVAFFCWNRKTHLLRFTAPEFSRWDLLVFAIFLFLFFIRVGRADNACDTLNYHIIHQENPFRNFVTQDFFPGTREVFFPALADRMYYPFRLLLGYRMGTLLYTLLMMLTYFCSKRLILQFLPRNSVCSEGKQALLSLACGSLLISNFVGHEICSYYVDLFPVPLMFYVLGAVITDQQTDRRGDPFLGLCIGIIVAIKLSYAFLLLPLGLLFLWENRKRLSPGLFLTFAVLGLIPVAVYLMNAWIQTGNPIYPLFNTLFHSPYLSDQQREVLNGGGPSNLLDGLIRPFYWGIQSDNSGYIVQSDGRITLGFISAVILLVLPAKKASDAKRVRLLAVIHICMVYMTVFFIDAYPRLALIIEPMGGILILLLVVRLYQGQTIRLVQRITAFALSVALLVSVSYAGILLLLDHYEFSWEYPAYLSNGGTTRAGLKFLFKDYPSSQKENPALDEVKCWVAFCPIGGLMRMLEEDVPVLQAQYASGFEYRQEQMETLLQKYGTDGLYTLANWASIGQTLDYMTDDGYVISGPIETFNSCIFNGALYLIPVQVGTTGNSYYSLNDSQPSYTQKITEGKTLRKITGYTGLSSLIKSWNEDFKPITLRFSLVSGDTTTVLAETTIAPDFEYHTLALPCEIQVKAGDMIAVEALNPDGNPYGYFIDLINIKAN